VLGFAHSPQRPRQGVHVGRFRAERGDRGGGVGEQDRWRQRRRRHTCGSRRPRPWESSLSCSGRRTRPKGSVDPCPDDERQL